MEPDSMPIVEFIDAESERLVRMECDVEASLCLAQLADIWLRCGYTRNELRNVGWLRGEEIMIQCVPASIITGGRIA